MSGWPSGHLHCRFSKVCSAVQKTNGGSPETHDDLPELAGFVFALKGVCIVLLDGLVPACSNEIIVWMV